MTKSRMPGGAGQVTPGSEDARGQAGIEVEQKRADRAIVRDFDAERKDFTFNYGGLARAACNCQLSGTCSPCTAWRAVFDDLADRNAEATERAVQARLNRLALDQQQAATRRRPVRDMPRRRRIDLDALADAVALRLGKAP